MRIEQLTFTRFLAAFAILLYHFAKEDVFPFNNPILNKFVEKGSVGVSFFFILSGFVMCLAYYNRKEINLKKFFVSRFARIYPVFFLATFLFVLEWVVLKNEINIIDVVISFSVLQSWIPGKELILNSPAWSLGVELLFYLLFPFFLNKFIKKKSFKIIRNSIFIFFIISQIFFFYSIQNNYLKEFIYYNPFMHLSSFFMGNLGGIILAKNMLKKRNNDLLVVIVTILLFGFVYFNNFFFLHNGLLALLIVPLLLLLSFNNGMITRIFKHPKLVLLGEISYGFYILQFPIFIPFRNILDSFFNISSTTTFYICTVFLFVTSYLTYFYFEKPLQMKIKSFKK